MSEGTAFQKKVWCEIDKIPRGEVVTYSKIAENTFVKIKIKRSRLYCFL